MTSDSLSESSGPSFSRQGWHESHLEYIHCSLLPTQSRGIAMAEVQGAYRGNMASPTSELFGGWEGCSWGSESVTEGDRGHIDVYRTLKARRAWPARGGKTGVDKVYG